MVNGESMACTCGSDHCSAASASRIAAGGIVIQVLAEAATVEGTGDKPGYLPGHGVMPAEAVRELAKRARLRPVMMPERCSR